MPIAYAGLTSGEQTTDLLGGSQPTNWAPKMLFVGISWREYFVGIFVGISKKCVFSFLGGEHLVYFLWDDMIEGSEILLHQLRLLKQKTCT